MVGKTCMLISYTENRFIEKHVPTVFDQHDSIIPDCPTAGVKTRLGLWDTAGQEHYDRLRPLSYPDTDVFIVCYAINIPSTFENVANKWLPEIHFHCGSDVAWVLVGTKSDLRESAGAEAVDFKEAQAKGKELGAAEVIECSAKTRENLDEVYLTAIKVALKHRASHKKKRKCVLL